MSEEQNAAPEAVAFSNCYCELRWADGQAKENAKLYLDPAGTIARLSVEVSEANKSWRLMEQQAQACAEEIAALTDRNRALSEALRDLYTVVLDGGSEDDWRNVKYAAKEALHPTQPKEPNDGPT